jgi:lipoic acid synthetase
MLPGLLLIQNLVPYERAWTLQQRWVAAKQKMDLPDLLILLEHPPIITLGRWGKEDHLKAPRDVLDKEGINVVRCERGGDITYHGPGQLVGYPIIQLKKFAPGVKTYVRQIEEVLIRTLSDFGLAGYRKDGFPGVWAENNKIASIGIAVHKGITFHGFALNYAPNPAHSDLIVPCGLNGVRMTSLQEIVGPPVKRRTLQEKVRLHFEEIFGIRLEPVSLKEMQGMLESVPLSKDKERRLGSALPDSEIRNRQSEIEILPAPNSELQTKKPPWLKKKISPGLYPAKVINLLSEARLHTVCQEARCPNQGECFGRGSATFLLMGDRCTRNCSFCAVTPGLPEPLNEEEPVRIARAVKALGLSYAVLTSVTRDDLPDGGADHFVKVIKALRSDSSGTTIECLVPDFKGSERAFDCLADGEPQVINHNIETIGRLYPIVRPEAGYGRSLAVLKYFKQKYPSILTKSGFMVGLGESRAEIRSLLQDLRGVGCETVTIGQYLQPTPAHHPVSRYVTPDEFKEWEEEALKIGFLAIASGPFVRSSYKAEELYNKARRKGEGNTKIKLS